MIPLIGNPPPAAEAKFRAALRLVGEALIEWSDSIPSHAVEPNHAPAAASAPARPMARPISEILVWTGDHDRLLRELAGTAPAQKVAEQLGVSLSTLYKHSSRLKMSLAVVRADGEQGQPKETASAKPAVSTPARVPVGVVYTEENFARLRQLAGTMPKAAVVAEMGLSRTSVEKLARHLELSLRPEKAKPADTAAAKGKRGTFIIPDGHEAERDADGRATGTTVAAGGVAKDNSQPEQSEVAPEPQAPAPVAAEPPTPEIPVPAVEAPAPQVAAEPEPAPLVDLSAEEASPAVALQVVVPQPTEAPRRSAVVSVPAIPRGDRSAPNKRAPAIAPTRPTWFRLQHPDGRWLRMDCLGWVKDKKDSYHAHPKFLDAVRRKFPLAAECRVVPEPAWTPRDVEFSRATR